MLQVYTGNGKGKTTAAIGQAVRAAGAGMKAAIFFFLKDGKFPLSEIKSLEKAGVKCFRLKQRSPLFDKKLERADLKAAVERDMRAVHTAAGRYDLLVLDEFVHVLNMGLLDRAAAVKELKGLSLKTEIIATGRGCPADLKAAADLVTEMKEIKHPYHKGVKARKGIDF